MGELIPFLFLAIVLVVVTLVGHGLWLLFAALFRAIFGREGARRSVDETRCGNCRRWTTLRLPRCEWCGHVLLSEAAELAAFRRQLDRLAREGAIKPEAAQALVARAEELVRRKAEAAKPQPVEAVTRPPRPGEVLVPADVAEVQPPPAPSPAAPVPEVRPVATPPGPAAPIAATVSGAPAVAPAAPGGAAATPATTASRPTTLPSRIAGAASAAAPAAETPARPSPFPAAPAVPKKSWGEVFLEFLEERNIRLGEFILVIIGGLLIVGGSVAVVISLWHQIQENYLQLAVFVAISSAAFGLGFFTYYHWKLEITGRTWLTIATLLVPLIFLAVVSFSRQEWSVPMLLAEGLSLCLFAYLVAQASRVLVPGPWWHQVLAVVGNAAAVLLAGHLIGTGSEVWRVVAAGALPVALFGVAMGAHLYQGGGAKPWDAERAAGLFALLGTGGFALAVAFGLVVAKGAVAEGALARVQHLAPLGAVAAVAVLASGLGVVRGAGRDMGLAGFRTAGTAVALGGAAAMLAAVLAAWPWPPGLVGVALVNAATLSLVAFRYRLPMAHAGAIACVAVAYLVGFYMGVGDLSPELPTDAGRHLMGLLIDARTGTALAPLFAVLAVAAEGLARIGRRRHAVQYLGGAAVVALASLALVTVHRLTTGAGRDLHAMAVYALYGTVSLAMAARWPRKRFVYLGLALWVGASLWGLGWYTDRQFGPLWAAKLAGQALVFGLGGAVLTPLTRGRNTSWQRYRLVAQVYGIPLLHMAEAVGTLALVLALGAWRMRQPSPIPLVTFASLAALGFVTAWVWRSSLRTWVASAVVLVGLVHTLAENYRELVSLPHLVAFLGHAVLAVGASIAIRLRLQLKAMARPTGVPAGNDQFLWASGAPGHPVLANSWRVFAQPLVQSGLLSSAMALAVAVAMPGKDVLWLAECLFVLSAIWLGEAWMERWPSLLSAAQAVLTGAVVLAATAWLERHPWDAALGVDLTDPRSLQLYGLALGLLTLGWLGVRLVLRDNPAAWPMLEPGWPAVDRVVGHAVAVGQLMVAGFYAAVACQHELVPGLGPVAGRVMAAFGPTAWWTLCVVAFGLVGALGYRWRTLDLLAALLTAATVPYLIAGGMGSSLASATALRWTGAAAFLAGAAVICIRRPLVGLGHKCGARLALGPGALGGAHGVLLVALGAPVLILTLYGAGLRLGGILAQGPVGTGILAAMDIRVAYLVPLVLVATALVALAVRENSAGYAFGGGLVVTMLVVLGYLLHVVHRGGPLDISHKLTAVQWASITTALWAICWLAVRNRLPVWREEHRPHARALMQIQVDLALLGNLVLLAPGLGGLMLSVPGHFELGAAWTVAVGRPAGWLALAAALIAAMQRQRAHGQRVRPEVAGLVGMGALGLLACTVRGLLPDLPEWAYRALMLGWAAYAVFVVAATWWIAPLRAPQGAEGPPQGLVRAAAGWNVAAGVLAVLLGLKAAFLHPQAEEPLWAAAAIALAATACAAMAVWRRQEGWAFAAALGTNLAASLVVWYFQRRSRPILSLREWWVLLVQANSTASSAVALVWLAARKRLYQLREFSVRTSPLLALQTALGVTTTMGLGIFGAGWIVLHPEYVGSALADLAAPPGWLALLLAGAAAGWYLRQIAPSGLLHVAVGVGLGAGVLLAAWAGAHAPKLSVAGWVAPWLGYHVLMVAWNGLAGLVLGAGVLGGKLRLAPQRDLEGAPSLAELLLPAARVREWVTVLGGLTVVLAAMYAHRDPARPWWSLGTLLTSAVWAGVLAVWQRRAEYVWLSGAVLNVAASVAWVAWGHANIASFTSFNILGLAIGSMAWSLLRPLQPHGPPNPQWMGGEWPFSHAAAILAFVALATLTVGLLSCDVLELPHARIDRVSWLAAAGVALAMLGLLWDRRAGFAWPGLYWTLVVSYGMTLDARRLLPLTMGFAAALELAGLALVAAAIALAVPRCRPLASMLRLPLRDPAAGAAADWFAASQAWVVGFVAILAGWVSMDLRFDGVAHNFLPQLSGRMGGPLAATLLVLVGVLTARVASSRWRTPWQHGTLWLGLLAISGLGWALLTPHVAPWMHRTVILMVGAVTMSLIGALGLSGALSAESSWVLAGRSCAKGFAGVALVALVLGLLQEAYFYQPDVGAPMTPAAALVVAAALVGLIGSCVTVALAGRLDPLGLSDRGRQMYVYAAEALLLLLLVHLRLTMPYLFRSGLIARYWMLIALAVAFAGAGLSELFQRRGLAVLSQPLERTALLVPLAPVVGFWLMKQPEAPAFLAGRSPAVWFLTSAFYAFMAASRRSSPWQGLLVLASIVAGNVGLWVLWTQLQWGFFENPQLWLIPVGLSILVAEFLNHQRLTPAQSAAGRYLGLSTIYIPSSIQYLGAIGQSVWLPLVLIGLSLAGVLAGIVLRVRSFLYLGTTFLALVVVTMVRYAAVDLRQTWILYLCCVGLGVAAIALVAFYEKRREAILEAVKGFRRWQR